MTDSGFWWVESHDYFGADAAATVSRQLLAARGAGNPANCSRAGTLAVRTSNSGNPR
jgi:hypothetical protein